MVRSAVWVLGCLVLVGCGRCGRLDGLAPADVLYVGDSVLAWNEKTCRSIGAYAAEERGVGYESVAKNGAILLSGESSIPEQHLDGSWSTVVIDGGANDLNSGCECGDCDGLMARLASEDGTTGAMPDLVDRWVAEGADVLLLGYYPVPDSAWYGFDRCFDTITELDRRYALVAEQREHVRFFDLGDVIGPDGEGGVYAFDFTHPSPKGAQLLGEAVAAQLP
ncbi:MAG: SGNH/GDSL hydrolase family protein [Myxococcota bacterium]